MKKNSEISPELHSNSKLFDTKSNIANGPYEDSVFSIDHNRKVNEIDFDTPINSKSKDV